MASLLTLAVCLGLAGGDGKLSPAELAARIDSHISRKLAEAKVPPADLAGDAEFVRRAALDLTGRVPDILNARDYIDNPAKDKRAAIVRRLLADKRYALHWAYVWRGWMIPDASDQQVAYLAPGFEAWLREQLKENAKYDQIARRILSFDVSGGMGYGAANVAAFYQAQQYKPENVASISTRLFMGVKLECAQCHNHPFAKWSKKQFWETAAFFSNGGGFDPTGRRGVTTRGTGKIKMPGNDKEIAARFLDGKEPTISGDARSAFADWLTAKENPFFARAAVNRLWEQMFGTGLVEPLDEESTDNPASHPELLDLMAKQFALSGFDLKYVLEAIALSDAYARASKQTHPGQADHRLFARARVRGLSPEQLFDSLTLVTGQDDDATTTATSAGFNPFNPLSPRADFLRRFPNQDRRGDQQTSILQALYLMNGAIVTDAVSLEKNKNLAIIAQATTVRTSRRVEQLFLIALNRKPTPEETARMVKYVDAGGPAKDPARALCDVFWALLNSSEFCTNH